MATGVNGIATRGDCNTIVAGAFTGDLTRCPTKAEILATGKLQITNASNYSDNQCVKYSDITIATGTAYQIYVNLQSGQSQSSMSVKGYEIGGTSVIPDNLTVVVNYTYGLDENNDETFSFTGNSSETRTFPFDIISAAIVLVNGRYSPPLIIGSNTYTWQ